MRTVSNQPLAVASRSNRNPHEWRFGMKCSLTLASSAAAAATDRNLLADLERPLREPPPPPSPSPLTPSMPLAGLVRGGDSEAPCPPPLTVLAVDPPIAWDGGGEWEVLAPGRVERSASAIAFRTFKI